jgi:hypothetical protein
MAESVFGEKTMIRYLLGQLSEEERVSVESSFFENDALFEQLTAMEEDLIDDYVRGRLPVEQQKAFQKKFLTDNNWKQRVVFAEALSQRVGERRPQAQSLGSRESFFQTLLGLLRIQGPIFQTAVAATGLVIVIGIVWLASQAIQARRNVQALEAERRNLEKTVEDLKGQVAGLQRDSRNLSNELDQERSTRGGSDNQRTGNTSPLGSMASFILRAGVVRGPDDAPRLKVPAGVATVRLRLEVNPADDYPAYKAELRTAAGSMIWSGDMLRAQGSGRTKTVDLDVPAQRLRAGNYELALLGRVDPGKLEDVAYYYFTLE